MAFLLYKKTYCASTVLYEKDQSLKLGGRGGLIARQVQKLGAVGAEHWKLEVADLLDLAGLSAADENYGVVFDAAGSDANNVCLYELSRLHGSCRDTSTQLALDFTVLVDQSVGGDVKTFTQKFEISKSARLRVLCEMLALTGGPGGGDWKWAATSLQLGATLVQPVACSR